MADIDVVSVDQVDHTVLVGHLNEIVDVLQIAITDVKLVLKSSSYLSHNGKILSVDEVAHVVFHLLDVGLFFFLVTFFCPIFDVFFFILAYLWNPLQRSETGWHY